MDIKLRNIGQFQLRLSQVRLLDEIKIERLIFYVECQVFFLL